MHHLAFTLTIMLVGILFLFMGLFVWLFEGAIKSNSDVGFMLALWGAVLTGLGGAISAGVFIYSQLEPFFN